MLEVRVAPLFVCGNNNGVAALAIHGVYKTGERASDVRTVALPMFLWVDAQFTNRLNSWSSESGVDDSGSPVSQIQTDEHGGYVVVCSTYLLLFSALVSF